jgi:hypothetical protein
LRGYLPSLDRAMFKNTQTLGTTTFKGQKQLVVDALLSSPKPKTLEEIVALVNKDGARLRGPDQVMKMSMLPRIVAMCSRLC